MLGRIRRPEVTGLSPEHVPAKVNEAEYRRLPAIGRPLAVQETQGQLVLSAAAETASVISEYLPAGVAPAEVGSVALRAAVRREAAANVAHPACVHAAAAVEAVAVAEGGKQS